MALYARDKPVKAKRSRRKKLAAELKARQFNVRMTHELYAEFSKMAQNYALTRSSLVRKLFAEEKVRIIKRGGQDRPQTTTGEHNED